MVSTPVPRPGAEDQPPAFTAQEEAFLRAYSESLNRMQALAAAGIMTQAPDLIQQQALMQEASRIIGDYSIFTGFWYGPRGLHRYQGPTVTGRASMGYGMSPKARASKWR